MQNNSLSRRSARMFAETFQNKEPKGAKLIEGRRIGAASPAHVRKRGGQVSVCPRSFYDPVVLGALFIFNERLNRYLYWQTSLNAKLL